MIILGISCDFHDSAAALVIDGDLLAAASEERFSRIKHDPGFPRMSINFCLNEAGIAPEDIDRVVFYEKPLLKVDRVLRSSLDQYPRSCGYFREGMLAGLTNKMWIKGRIAKSLGISPHRIFFCEHHVSHAASAFYCSGFPDAAILTVDGVGEWATASTGFASSGSLVLDRELRWPHSVGMLYSVFTAFLGFEVNEGEYKVMGLAPYGRPRFEEEVWKLVRIDSDGAAILNLEYFSFHRSPRALFADKFVSVFGPPRQPGRPFDLSPLQTSNEGSADQHYADIAASIQKVLETIVLAMAEGALSRYPSKRLALQA